VKPGAVHRRRFFTGQAGIIRLDISSEEEVAVEVSPQRGRAGDSIITGPHAPTIMDNGKLGRATPGRRDATRLPGCKIITEGRDRVALLSVTVLGRP
jgi:hypothetical protein